MGFRWGRGRIDQCTDVVGQQQKVVLAMTNIITRRGKIARLESGLTPHEAQVEDLVFLRKVLKKANIPFLLIRGNKSRPILAVDIELRSAVDLELTAACANEPMYAKTVDKSGLSPVLVAYGRLSPLADPRIMRLYRRRIAPGGFRYGPEFGVELQFWVFEETEVLCPVENLHSIPLKARAPRARRSLMRMGITQSTHRKVR